MGAIHFPNLVRATEPALSLTIYNASSSALTLKVMLIIALVGMPVVIGYTIYAYKYFGARLRRGITEGYHLTYLGRKVASWGKTITKTMVRTCPMAKRTAPLKMVSRGTWGTSPFTT